MDCLKIDTQKLRSYNIESKFNYNFSFLNLNINNINIIYDILNKYEKYKFKNIYKFIYDRIFKLNELYNIELLPKKNMKYISSVEFNTLITDYINNDKLKEIIIINSIQLYYLPI
mgnify:CR=1 FL=1